MISISHIRERQINDYKNYTQVNKDLKVAIISVGDDYGSKVYVNNKLNLLNECGIEVEHIKISDDDTPENIVSNIYEVISELNWNDTITGILLQLPISKISKEDTDFLLNSINPEKDIDCLTDANIMNIRQGKYLPCTVQAIMDILNELNISVEDKSVTILGRSKLVGSPLRELLDSLNANVTVLHSKTSREKLKQHLAISDIVVSAVGKENLFSSEYLSKDKQVIVIDVGISRGEDNKITGDFNSSGLDENSNIIFTPVPKGVGLLTTSNVVGNTIKLHKQSPLLCYSSTEDTFTEGFDENCLNEITREHLDMFNCNQVSLDDDNYFNTLLENGADLGLV